MGNAVQGKFKYDEVSIFRLNNNLSKAFLSSGKIEDRPQRNDSCRTQILVNIPSGDIQKLKEKPLGNHHLIIPENHIALLSYFCNDPYDFSDFH